MNEIVKGLSGMKRNTTTDITKYAPPLRKRLYVEPGAYNKDAKIFTTLGI